MHRAMWWTILMTGCVLDHGDDGGQSGTELPPRCVEDTRADVTDLATPAGGLDFSAQAAIDGFAGTWTGTADVDGTDTPVGVTLARTTGAVQIVTTHYEAGTGGACEACDVPEPVCGAYYEIPLRLDLDASPALTAGAETTVDVGAVGEFDARIEVDPSDVGGTLEAPAWDHPEYWDRTVLAVQFSSFDGATNQLDATWFAINDDPLQETDTASGTGTVEPSGQSQPVFTAVDLTRAR